MSRKQNDTWTPSPEFSQAFSRVLNTTHIAASTLWGEKPTDKAADEASGRVLLQQMGMIYFLLRVDPQDIIALYTGEGSLGSLNYKPFPPNYWHKKGIFTELMQ